MMRRIIASSLRFRFIVVARGDGADRLRLRPGPRDAGRCVPRVRAAAGRDADDRARAHRGGSRVAGHHPAGASARRVEGSTSSAPSPWPSCRRSSSDSSRAPTCCEPGSSSRSGSAGVTPDAPNLGESAVHHAAALSDEPGHEDRPVVGHGRPARSVQHLVLDDPGAPARRTRRCQRDDLGRAHGAVPRPDDPGEAGGSMASPSRP